MAESEEPKLITILTCLEASSGKFYTLTDVFRALPGVPDGVVVYLEFEASDAFSYAIALIGQDGKPTYDSEENLVLKALSGRIEHVLELPLGIVGILPGSYNIQVKDADSGRVMGCRRIFLGEM